MKKSIDLHRFIRHTGGISIAAVAMVVIGVLLYSTPVKAADYLNPAFESQLRFVSLKVCAECHPSKNPGKCNLIQDHKNLKKAQCMNCHATCSNDAPPPNFNHFERTCGECHRHTLDYLHGKHDSNKGFKCSKCHSGKKVLIAYDGKHGSTQIYAEQLGDVLNDNGYQVDIGRAMNLLEIDISRYDGIVLGSPTYTGIPLPGLKRFIDAHRNELAGNQVGFLYNGLTGGQTGNSYPRVFWRFTDSPVLINYPDIFPLAPWRCATYPVCNTVPYWVGLMPGRYIPSDAFPSDYLAMELIGYGGGVKNYLRPDAAREYAQVLLDCNFFSETPNTPPTATATATPGTVTKGSPIQFTAVVTSPVGNLTYLWDFGDGSTSTAQNPTHTYACHGTFTVKLRVIDDALSCPAQVALLVTVNKPAGEPILYGCDVQPVLTRYCQSCHGIIKGGGLDVRDCNALAQGGNSGPSVIPGNRWASSLYTTIINNSMPPGGEPPPTPAETEKIGQWIDSLNPNLLPSEICLSN